MNFDIKQYIKDLSFFSLFFYVLHDQKIMRKGEASLPKAIRDTNRPEKITFIGRLLKFELFRQTAVRFGTVFVPEYF